MKKYFVLALALMAFAVAPVMADVALSGEYNYSAAWDTSDSKFAGDTDKLELDLAATLDDYNTFKLEVEEAGDDQAGEVDVLDEALAINYAKVITDWGKYFGFAESGFGMTTTTGLFDVETKETADFTGYNFEYGYADLGTTNSIMVDFDIMGMVNVYYGQAFDTYTAGDANPGVKGFLMGAQASIDPVTVEAYYKMTGVDKGMGNVFGLEAAYSGEVSDGVVLNAAGNFQMGKGVYPGQSGAASDAFDAFVEAYDDENGAGAFLALAGFDSIEGYDEMNSSYGFGIGAEAYGATINASFWGAFLGSDAADAMDDPSYALAQFGIDAEYSVLEWLSVNGGMLFNMGDYKDDFGGEEAFAGAEFGVSIMPGAVTYQLGYIAANEDAGNYALLEANSAPAKGGIYFVVDLDY